MEVMQRQQQQEQQASEAQQADDMQEEDCGPLLIAQLETVGVNAADIDKLRGAGFYTVESVAYATLKSLTAIKGMSEAKCQKLLAQASELIPMGFTTATEFHKQRQELIHLTTGSKELDTLLAGEIGWLHMINRATLANACTNTFSHAHVLTAHIIIIIIFIIHF
jgi:DNA repair protein RAD51